MSSVLDNVCILAGGSGTRLWPESNSRRPKQFIPIKGGKSLLLLTVERALKLSAGDIFIVTLDDQLSLIADELKKLESGAERVRLVAEPAPRNTAPAIAAAAVLLKNQGRGEEVMAVLPADHLIEPMERLAEDMGRAAALAARGHLVTFGVKPLRPETGYGYIEVGEALKGGFAVRRFREKPDPETARGFLEAGGFFWNSGMFCFRSDRYLQELESGRPDIAEVFSSIDVAEPSELYDGVPCFFREEAIRKLYAASPRDSVDYAVMERCGQVAMVEAHFNWNDIGSWDELHSVLDNDLEDPASGSLALESENCFVHSTIPVALCGVEDLMVVEKEGRLLICRKGQGQLVRNAVERYKAAGREDLV